jgi:hypothetical protein
MRKSTKILGALGASAVVLSTAGVAYAYWTATGTGTGSASSPTAAQATTGKLSVHQVAAPSALAPGSGAGAVTFTVKNDSPAGGASLYVTKVNVKIDSITGTAGCTVGDYTLGLVSAGTPTDNVDVTVGQELTATNSTATITGPTLSFFDTANDQSACKGAQVNLLYTAS